MKQAAGPMKLRKKFRRVSSAIMHFRDALVKVDFGRGEIAPSSARMVSNCNCLCVRAPSSDKKSRRPVW